jgi:aromatic ring-opening dioxygenase LigB subunit
MPHAPILIPEIGGSRQNDAVTTIAAMRKAARTMIAAVADTFVVISPHSPGIAKPIGFWSGERLRGSLTAFGFPHLAIDLPADCLLADTLAALSARRGVDTGSITKCSLDHGATVPLWFAAEAGWNGPTVVVILNSADPENRHCPRRNDRRSGRMHKPAGRSDRQRRHEPSADIRRSTRLRPARTGI